MTTDKIPAVRSGDDFLQEAGDERKRREEPEELP